MRLPAVSRRSILVGGGAAVGLVVAFLAWPRMEGSPLRAGSREYVFGPFLKIAADGRVTLAVPQVETGQGISTGLAQIAADELGAAWENMAVEPAPHGPSYANGLIAHELGVTTRITAGSSSVRAFEQILREAAAVARAMLCEAAAGRWGVSAAECDTNSGFVVHEGKRIGLGEVAIEAAGLKPPANVQLRPQGSGKLAGEALPRLDVPPKSDGSLRFASDVRLPRMVFASVRIAPPNGRLAGFSKGAAKRQQGLIDLVARTSWLAALGESWWAADSALARARPRFTAPQGREIHQYLAELLEAGQAEHIFERGDYAAATSGATPLAATYSIAPAPHRSLEAPAAVARLDGNRLEVWAGTRIADLARSEAARAGGIAEQHVTIYPMPIGDGSGSGFDLEPIRIAVQLARLTSRPVSLAFPPATAQNQDSVRPPMLARMAALPAPDGSLRSWSARIVGMAGLEADMARAQAAPIPQFNPRGAEPPYNIPAIRIDAIDAGLPIRSGYMRGSHEAALTFATESFIDEMARVLGAEPLAFRVGLLGGTPRLAKAIMTAAAIGGWDGGGGSSVGLACASLYGSHIGLLAEATISPDQRIKVSRLVAAVDAGRIVNPGLVRQQIEGGLLAALAAASVPASEYIANMPRAMPMADRGFERLADVPRIEVELIQGDGQAGGVSGLGMAVLAPAVANAIASGTGRRLRNLPFDPMS
jgi:isoquinoline 1-oxidoreductase beta subunit